MNHPPLQEILMTNFKTLAALMMTALMAAGTASAADGKFSASGPLFLVGLGIYDITQAPASGNMIKNTVVGRKSEVIITKLLL